MPSPRAAVAEALAKNPGHFRHQERVRLSGRKAHTYVRMLIRLLEAGRLNRTFPNPDRLNHLYRFLDPKQNHGLYPDLEIGGRTGLPVEKSVTRVQADHAVALTGGSHAYHRDLCEQPVSRSFHLDMDLRFVDPDSRRAHFIVILDRFDLVEELFVRYTIAISHKNERWSRSQVTLEGDDLEATKNFKNLVARSAAHDSEIAFLLLSEIPSLTVESITRTRVGPLQFAGLQGIDVLQKLTDRHPGEMILSLPTDRAGLEVGKDRNRDPFSMGYRDFLVPAARKVIEEKRKGYGYHVFRDRKFVCTKGIAKALNHTLKKIDRSSVVYTLS